MKPARTTKCRNGCASSQKRGEKYLEQEIKALLKTIVASLDAKKASDIKVLSVKSVTVLADYFVICNGTSNTQVKALADEVEFKCKENLSVFPHHIEGYDHANWILIDYGSVIVHVFYSETRDFYKLERLWSDAVNTELDDILS
jgi:ribosome-associated protein